MSKIDIHKMPSGVERNSNYYGMAIVGGGSHETAINSYDVCQSRYFEYYSISHMYNGRGKLWIKPDYEEELHPGHCIIICPETVNRYGGSNNDSYQEDSLWFFGPVADKLKMSGIIKDGAFDIGITRRLLPIFKLIQDPAVDTQINAVILLQKVLMDIYNEDKKRKSGSIVTQLIETLKNQIEKWWTVDEMAEFCNLSDDQFRRVFHNETGMLPKTYLDNLKLKKAAELLNNPDLKITDIAERLGYIDPYHFSRRFKKIIGCSPRTYRKEFSIHFS
ncbi:MAG: helix-turn-helix transcriptional regulator [Lentisphaerae bacterium]|nr:helix-turn-helix transcriptional regulator [Lentisphaerota bacterium]MCP4102511.1 helix-turn-helix transcriptional regulator [Lentisphaerota bacterium]